MGLRSRGQGSIGRGGARVAWEGEYLRGVDAVRAIGPTEHGAEGEVVREGKVAAGGGQVEVAWVGLARARSQGWACLGLGRALTLTPTQTLTLTLTLAVAVAVALALILTLTLTETLTQTLTLTLPLRAGVRAEQLMGRAHLPFRGRGQGVGCRGGG